jgi:hypothetical protein
MDHPHLVSYTKDIIVTVASFVLGLKKKNNLFASGKRILTHLVSYTKDIIVTVASLFILGLKKKNNLFVSGKCISFSYQLLLHFNF